MHTQRSCEQKGHGRTTEVWLQSKPTAKSRSLILSIDEATPLRRCAAGAASGRDGEATVRWAQLRSTSFACCRHESIMTMRIMLRKSVQQSVALLRSAWTSVSITRKGIK